MFARPQAESDEPGSNNERNAVASSIDSITSPLAASAKSNKPKLNAEITINARCRVDRRTKRIIKRLCPGDVAIIDHADIDRVAAESLVEKRPSVVINASSSITGRYPAVGALVLAEHDIVVMDNAGPEVMNVDDGASISVQGSHIFAEGKLICIAQMQNVSTLTDAIEGSKQNLSSELQAFAENTLQYIREESPTLFDPPDPPDIGVRMKGRHVMVVVRGHDYRDDITHLRSYVREMRPVIIAVDGGADACLSEGLKPDVILGDFDSATDNALQCGAKLVVHAYVGGNAPGAKRLDELGENYVIYEAPGTSEDVAMLLAYEEGAELIVAVGTHASMIEFLDKGRSGMASTFLTRMKVGPILVDAKGVSRLYKASLRKSDLAFLIASAMVAFLVMALVSYPFRLFLQGGWFIIEQNMTKLFRTLSLW